MSGHSYENETKERIKVEEHDLSEGTFIESRYLGTDADRHDMVVMGRKQVLRVSSLRKWKPYVRFVYSQLTNLLSATSKHCQWWALPLFSSAHGSFFSRMS